MRTRMIWLFFLVMAVLAAVSIREVCAAEGISAAEPERVSLEALYLGVADYGAPETVKENIASFRYRFLVDGEEWVLPVCNGEPDAEGRYAYPIQNCLKRGYRFVIEITDGTVTAAREIPENTGPDPQEGVNDPAAPGEGRERANAPAAEDGDKGDVNAAAAENEGQEDANTSAAENGGKGDVNAATAENEGQEDTNISAAEDEGKGDVNAATAENGGQKDTNTSAAENEEQENVSTSAAEPGGAEGEPEPQSAEGVPAEPERQSAESFLNMPFTPGERTLKNLLSTALAPAGTALYIYGGGWDWQDEGAGPQTVSIGVSPDWQRFFAEQDENFTYRDRNDDAALRDPAASFYPFGRFNEYYYAGLDCSGYLGWVIYNVMNTTDGAEGYVGRAKDFAAKLASFGWGRMEGELMDEHGLLLRPGDIVSNRGHVWMVIGSCSDGSAVIAHSFQSPSRTGQPGGGVQLSALAWTEDCEAMRLARDYMAQECPEWYRRYDVSLKSPDIYLGFDGYEGSGCFRWSLTGENGGITDPDGFADLTADEVLSLIRSR